MAEKRMFAKTITNSDAFLDMPLSSQCLYFHLSMNADDDGFINKPKSIIRMVGAKEDDLNVLIAKSFIIPFDDGIVVIKHWRINNIIRQDRYHPTEYKEHLNSLNIKENKAYSLNNGKPICKEIECPSERYDDVYVEEETIVETKKSSVKPTVEEIEAYCKERNNNVDAQQFFDFYEAKNWMIGKNKMKDWKAAIRTWERNDTNPSNKREVKVPDWYKSYKEQLTGKVESQEKQYSKEEARAVLESAKDLFGDD